MDIVGLLIGIIGLAVACWQHTEAKKAKAELAAELATHMRRMPDQLLNRVTKFLKGSQGEALEFYDLQESGDVYHTRTLDIDGDGSDELIVQYPFGLHNAALEIFKANHDRLRRIARITANTMAGFVIEDFDNDGRLEVQTFDVSQAADLPYVCGFRDQVWFRFENGKFVEVQRLPVYSDEDLIKFKSDPEKALLGPEAAGNSKS